LSQSHSLPDGPLERPEPAADLPVCEITAGKAERSLGIEELWAYRDVLFYLTRRDLFVRYKQTLIGASWAIIQPVMTMVIFTIFFGRLAKIPSDGVPYPVFSLAALVPWSFFADGVLKGSQSTVQQAEMIKKVYFPRLAMPLAPLLARLVDMGLAFAVLACVMFAYGIVPGWQIAFLPGFVLLAFITALGASLWLSALNVQFRDVGMAAPFLIQSWLFLTPIAYPSSMLEEPWRTFYAINPMAGVVEGFRWALLGTDTAPGAMILVSTATALIMLVSGIYYFRRTERTFADVI
jgi:lipopolysaccharide transport system permease protein